MKNASAISPQGAFRERARVFVSTKGAAAAFYLIGTIIDTLLTYYTVNKFGIEGEANPVYAMIMSVAGIRVGLLFQFVGEILIILLLTFTRNTLLGLRITTVFYICGTVHFLGAVTHIPNLLDNFFVIERIEANYSNFIQ